MYPDFVDTLYEKIFTPDETQTKLGLRLYPFKTPGHSTNGSDAGSDGFELKFLFLKTVRSPTLCGLGNIRHAFRT